MKTAEIIKLICPECQRENEAERIYCHDCGARLDRSAASSRVLPRETMAQKRKRVRRLFDARRAKIRAWVFQTARLLLGALVLASVVQLALPPDVPPAREKPAGISQISFDLENALNQHNGAHLQFTEDQVNEHLGYALKIKKSSLDKPCLEFKRAVAQISEGICVITVERSIFGFSVYTAVNYSVQLNSGKVSLVSKGGKIGRMQIHPIIFRYVGIIFADVWAALDRERKLVAKMSAVEFHEKAVSLTAPGPGQ
jgi:hypothetical protein